MADAPDAGVIEDARARQRRHRWWLAVAVGVVGLVVLLVLAFGGGRSNADGRRGLVGPTSPLTVRHGYAYADGEAIEVEMTPYLRAGWVLLNMTQSIRGVGVGLASGLSQYPTQTDPGFGFPSEGVSFRYSHGAPMPAWGAPVGSGGEIDMLLVGPTVASMRVAHLGTFKPVHVLGLLAGERAIVFYRPPGARGILLGPGLRIHPGLPPFSRAKGTPVLSETLYDIAGKPIPIRESVRELPVSFWQAPASPPSSAHCLIGSTLAGASAQWGQVTTSIAADPAVIGPAFLSCAFSSYRWDNASFDVAVLVNAQSPGRPPAPLWNASPVAGNPGTVVIKAVVDTERTRGQRTATRNVLAPVSVAHRIGEAWIVVDGGSSEAQQLRLLNSIRITRLNLSHR